MSKSKAEELFYETWKANTSLSIEREVAFAKSIGRRWRFDFALSDYKIGIEIQGAGFGHTTMKGTSKDYEKNNAAIFLGWKVLQYPAKKVKDAPQYVVDEILDWLSELGIE